MQVRTPYPSAKSTETYMLHSLRRIMGLSWPLLIAQLSGMGMLVADTVILGHYSPLHLAALAVGSGVYVSTVLALGGILQAVAPLVAHATGAERTHEVTQHFQQGIWLACALGLAGMLLLQHPDFILGLSPLPDDVHTLTREYLFTLSFAIPGVLMYRVFVALCNGVGQTRIIMMVTMMSTVVHIPLATHLAHAGWFGANTAHAATAAMEAGIGMGGLGVLGCAISTAVVSWLGCAMAAGMAMRNVGLKHLHLLLDWQKPQFQAIAKIVKLGGPMGFSNFVETTSFTLIALFVAQLGSTEVAGHRIVSNLYALSFMLPLSMANGTLVAVGQSLGAKHAKQAALNARAGVLFAVGLCACVAIAMWLARIPLLHAYTDTESVQQVALKLLPLLGIFLVFDAVQTLSSFSLRAYKVTLLPMFIHVTCFWGIGLFGGWYLAFRGFAGLGGFGNVAPCGTAGFWVMSASASAVAGCAMLWLLRRHAKRHIQTACSAPPNA